MIRHTRGGGWNCRYGDMLDGMKNWESDICNPSMGPIEPRIYRPGESGYLLALLEVYQPVATTIWIKVVGVNGTFRFGTRAISAYVRRPPNNLCSCGTACYVILKFAELLKSSFPDPLSPSYIYCSIFSVVHNHFLRSLDPTSLLRRANTVVSL
jgi:hypothetical protein